MKVFCVHDYRLQRWHYEEDKKTKEKIIKYVVCCQKCGKILRRAAPRKSFIEECISNHVELEEK